MSAVTAETATAVERVGSVRGPLLVTVAILLVFFGIFGGTPGAGGESSVFAGEVKPLIDQG